MYCGHCGAAVEDHDQFCRSCGARFVETAPAPVTASNLIGGASSGFSGGAEQTGAMIPISTAPFDVPPPPPTQLIPVVTGPGGRGARPFLIGGAFALIVIAGIVAFFVLRGDDSNAQPAPTGPTSPLESTTTTTNPLPSVETTLPVTVAPTTLPVETTAPPPPATPAPTAPPNTTPTSGTVPINTATIPGTTPTSGAPVATTAAPPAATRPPATAARTTTPTTRAPTPVGQTPVVGSATVSAIRASAARASGIDSCGQPTSYRPANVLDGQFDTAWMTVDNGGGQYLEFTIAPGAQLTQIGLVPGYAKQDPCSGSDRFRDMRRIVEVRWTFDGGNPITQTLDPESPTMQTIAIAATTPSVVRLTITATTDVGTAGFDYAPISEVTLA